MKEWDIHRVTAAYADAAERVKLAGLNGLEACRHLFDRFRSLIAKFSHDTLSFARKVLSRGLDEVDQHALLAKRR